MRSAPHPPRALGGGWTATLVIDAIVTLVTATALAGIGVLIPAFEEDYDRPAGRHLSEAAPFFGGAALLVASLVVTALVVRSGSDRRRRASLVTAAVRLGVLLAGALTFIVYGTLTYGG
ncbi:hypothetical protein PV390_09420 [Streptomyces sp. ME02-6991-2A]|uniref:hypothetical protein n=1 Tax=Streptomyces TaxID=1883 RepID=UPI0029B401F8|nr:hypothetical protein [Streptomyces sp. ME02-6991-2A]MDX3374631.1 hypothetical protein [Streptomyces sp. ME02-6991-2A]